MRGPGCGLHPWFAAEILWAGYEMPLTSAHASVYLAGQPVASRVGTTAQLKFSLLSRRRIMAGSASSQPSGLETVPPTL